MANAGACGFKIFTHAVPKGHEDEFLGICIENEGDIYTTLELIKETGCSASVHAENEALIQLFEGRVKAAGGQDAAAYLASRPPVVEAMSVAQLAVLCQAVRSHIHIAHVSCADALRVLQAASAIAYQCVGKPVRIIYSLVKRRCWNMASLP